jgi:hypothetical protein
MTTKPQRDGRQAAARQWQFRARFRARAFGWRGSTTAIGRLKEAVAEIRGAARTDPVVAGDGVVLLLERLWPALQDIDTSTGALGTAVNAAIDALLPILIAAPVTRKQRRGWLDRLFDALQEDGVDYLSAVGDRWGEIAVDPELQMAFAEMVCPLVEQAWRDPAPGGHVRAASVCLSCLLEAGRTDELIALLDLRRRHDWWWERFGAEALARAERTEEALARAERCRRQVNPQHRALDAFCESVLARVGRAEEAYRYGLTAVRGTTNLTVYREARRRYPDHDPRQLLLDLIAARGNRGKWFAAARSVGLHDIALECAADIGADPATLIRGARDLAAYAPDVAMAVGIHAVRHLVAGHGYESPPTLISEAVEAVFAAAAKIDAAASALACLREIAQATAPGGCEPRRRSLAAVLRLREAQT